MALQPIPGLPHLYLPDYSQFNAAVDGFNSANLTVAATGNQAIYVGRVQWKSGTSKTLSSSGGKIGLRLGAVTFATAGSVYNIGIQDVSAAAGPAGRGDGTFDVKKTMTQGTDTFTANAFTEFAMSSGTKTIANGDLIAIIVEATTRNGADSVVVVATAATGSGPNAPVVVTLLSGTYAGTANRPNVTLIADDGTYGTLLGAHPWATISTAIGNWNTGSATKEYGNLFSLPWYCRISGMWAIQNDVNTTGGMDFNIYSDPLNAGAGVTSVASTSFPARSGFGVNSSRLTIENFATPYDYVPNTTMCMAMKAASGTNVNATYFEMNSNAAWDVHPLGTACYAVSRNTVNSSTAFGTYGSTSRRIQMGLILSHFDDGLQPVGRAAIVGANRAGSW